MIIDCRAGVRVGLFPLASGLIRNLGGRQGFGETRTYWIMMETQIAHETAEFLIFQCHASKEGI
jgi:hypothetical protein